MALMGAYEYYNSIGDTENAAKWDSSKTMGDATNPVVIREYKDFMDAEAQYNIDSLYRAFLQVADIDFSKNEYTRLSISSNYPSIYVMDYYDFNGYRWTNIISRMNPAKSDVNTTDPEFGYQHMPCAVKFKMKTDIEVKKLKIQNFIVTDSDYGSCICFHNTNEEYKTISTSTPSTYPIVTINDPYISMVLNTRRQASGYPSVFLINSNYTSYSTTYYDYVYPYPCINIQNMFFKVSGLVNVVSPSDSGHFGNVLSDLIYNAETFNKITTSAHCIQIYGHFNSNFKLIDSTICYNDLIMNFMPSRINGGIAIIPCIPKTSCLHVVGNIKAIGKLKDTSSTYVPHLLTSDYSVDLSSLFLDFTIDISGMDSDSETFILKTSSNNVNNTSDLELKNNIYVNANKFDQDDSNILTKRTGVNYLTDEQMKDPEYLLSIGFTCFSVDDETT